MPSSYRAAIAVWSWLHAYPVTDFQPDNSAVGQAFLIRPSRYLATFRTGLPGSA
jgi:hypothetical protein